MQILDPLIEDVKTFIGVHKSDCIQLNSGSYQIEEDPFYLKGAIIPKQDWRSLDQNEQCTLLSQSSDVPQESFVGIVDLPNTSFKLLEEAGFYKCSTNQEVVDFQKRTNIHELLQPIYTFLSNFLVSEDDIVLTPFLTKPPNQLTVTTNTNNGVAKSVGVHLDTWDKLGLDKLSQARNRICINGGLQERYFLFYNLTVRKMVELLQNKGVENPEDLLCTHTLLGAFVKYYPNYPLIKLRVKPRQAYIAPTENIFHDATTLGTDQLDIHMTCRGYFRIH